VHIPQFLGSFPRTPDIEVVETRLPKSATGFIRKEATLAGIATLALGEQGTGGSLLQHLHDRGRSSDVWFGNHQMKMFRHDHISHDDEAITLTRLFQNGKEAVAAARSTKKRQPPIARASDKVQMVSAVNAMQTGRHRSHGSGSIVPALAQNARTGHPEFRNGKGKTTKGWATRPGTIPGEGQVLTVAQYLAGGAGIAYSLATVNNENRNMNAASAVGGIVTMLFPVINAGLEQAELSRGALQVLPVIGNVYSGLNYINDVYQMGNDYYKCLLQNMN